MVYCSCFYNCKTQEQLTLILWVHLQYILPPTPSLSLCSSYPSQTLPLSHPRWPYSRVEINTPITLLIFHKALLQKPIPLPAVLPHFTVPNIFFISLIMLVEEGDFKLQLSCVPQRVSDIGYHYVSES